MHMLTSPRPPRSTQDTLVGARAMRTGVSVAEYKDMLTVF